MRNKSVYISIEFNSKTSSIGNQYDYHKIIKEHSMTLLHQNQTELINIETSYCTLSAHYFKGIVSWGGQN